MIGPLEIPNDSSLMLGFRSGDVLVVTGAGSGIGKATALTAARCGLAVAAWDVDEASARGTVHEIQQHGSRAVSIKVDVFDPSQVASAWQATADFGACRYLVNNAGPRSRDGRPFADNLLNAVGSVESVTTRWLERCSDVAESMVNVSSIAGNFQGGGQTIEAFYPTSKMGIVGYTRHLATRFGGRPRANAVAPGLVETAATAHLFGDPKVIENFKRIPLGRPAKAVELGRAIVFLLSPAASYINGVLLPVDGGWSIN